MRGRKHQAGSCRKELSFLAFFSCGCKQYKSLHIHSLANVEKCFEMNGTAYLNPRADASDFFVSSTDLYLPMIAESWNESLIFRSSTIC
jgi:hypothetical protein